MTKSITLPRDPRESRRFSPSMAPRQPRWNSPSRARCPATALRPWYPAPAKTSLQRVPLLLDPTFARVVPKKPRPKQARPRLVPTPPQLASDSPLAPSFQVAKKLGSQ